MNSSSQHPSRVPKPAARLLTLLLAGSLTAQLPKAAENAKQPVALAVGRVVDERGQPLAGVAVQAFAQRSFVDAPAMLASPGARTDTFGRYRATLRQEHRQGWLVFAIGGRQTCARSLPWFRPGEVTAGADAVLMPGREIIGRLRAADGSPVVGAQVSVRSAIRSMWSDRDWHVSGARSDARGFFRIPCVAPAALDLAVHHQEHLPHRQLASVFAPLDLTLAPAIVVPVYVVDEDGAPAPDVSVSVKTVFGSDRRHRRRTDAVGRIDFAVPPNRRFEVIAARHPAIVRSGPLVADGEPVSLKLPPQTHQGRAVRVVVRDDATGATINGACVRPLNHDSSNASLAALWSRTTKSQLLGSAATVIVQRYTKSLWVEAPGFGHALVACPADEGPVEVRLGPECVVTGIVSDKETGKPAIDVAVRALPWFDGGGGTGQSELGPPRTDQRGRFEIRGLAAGAYALQVHVRGRRASLPVRIEASPAKQAEVELQVPRLAALKVTVHGEAANDAPGGLVPWLHHVQIATSERAGYNHSNPPSAPVAVPGPGRFEMAPMLHTTDTVFVRVPSRHRAGAIASRQLFRKGDHRGPIAFDQLVPIAVRGAIQTGPLEVGPNPVGPNPVGPNRRKLPFERLALLAVPLQADPQWPQNGPRPRPDALTFAAFDERGGFVVDLLPGLYQLHLVDLLTDIVFWSRPEPYDTAHATEPVTLRPNVHWLHVRCEPTEAGAELIVPPLIVQCTDANGDSRRGSLHPAPMLEFAPGTSRQSWLVPAGATVSVNVPDALANLRSKPVDDPLFADHIQIASAEQELVLALPAPP